MRLPRLFTAFLAAMIMAATGCSNNLPVSQNSDQRMGTNLFENGSMESGGSDPDGWKIIRWDDSGQAPFDMAWDKSAGHTGHSSLSIQCTGLGNSSYAFGGWGSKKITIDPTKTYMVSVWLRHEDTEEQPSFMVKLDFYDSDDNFAGTAQHVMDIRCKDGKWQQLRQTIARPDSIPADPPSPIAFMYVYFVLKDSQAQIWLDDAECRVMDASDMDLTTKYVYSPAPDIPTTASAPLMSATGSFGLSQDENGRWWMVNQSGRPYFDFAVDGGSPIEETAPELYGWVMDHYGSRSAYFMKDIMPRAKQWGFTSMASWSLMSWIPSADWLHDDAVNEGHGEVSPWQCCIFGKSINDSYHVKDSQGSSQSGTHGLVDPYNTQALSRMQSQVDDVVTHDRTWISGYFIENENWVNDLVHYIWSDSCRTELQNFLAARYSGIGDLNAQWGTDYASFAELVADMPQPGSFSEKKYRDYMDFSGAIFSKFHSEAATRIHAIDPGVAVFSNRFDYLPNDLVYLDALSVTDGVAIQWASCRGYLGPSPKAMYFINQVAERIQRPTIISEWHIGSQDTGLYRDGLNQLHDIVDTQTERGIDYREMMYRLASSDHVVGAHWFHWFDSVHGDWPGNNGLVKAIGDDMDQPWQPFMDMVVQTHDRVWNIDPAARTWDGIIDYPDVEFNTTSHSRSSCSFCSSTGSSFILLSGVVVFFIRSGKKRSQESRRKS